MLPVGAQRLATVPIQTEFGPEIVALRGEKIVNPCESDAVHPLILVIVTEYTPEAFAFMHRVVSPVDHRYV